jgi:acetylornithine deacetylase/succinyl-diaminopimelate desuccinylase-like protein
MPAFAAIRSSPTTDSSATLCAERVVAKRDELLPRKIMESTTQLLVDLCTISSASGDHDGVQRLAERMVAELAKRGLAAEVGTEPDEDGNPQPILIACGPQAGEHYLLLIGHMDTVLDAVPPRVDGHRLVATGALDMKGGLAMLVGALDLLAHRHQRPPEDLILVAVPDEEVAGTISERAVKRWGSDARAILVIEPGEARGDGETLVAGRRGLTEWRLDVTGRASHSGLAYWEGRSALAAAADWAAQAQRMSEQGRGPTVNVWWLATPTSSTVWPPTSPCLAPPAAATWSPIAPSPKVRCVTCPMRTARASSTASSDSPRRWRSTTTSRCCSLAETPCRRSTPRARARRWSRS